MDITSAEFLTSNSAVAGCPAPNKPEYAFIGRSNVGKSSLINMLTGKKGLAKTSSTPGKTQLINHFTINEGWYLVDLPGYGYAKTSKSLRKTFSSLITGYILQRENLINLFVLIDSRLEPQKIDLDFMQWLGENGIPFSMVFTKLDKLSSAQFGKNLAHYRRKMLETWEELPEMFLTSSSSATGRTELLGYIDKCTALVGGKFSH